nr:uncharacterized protein LOC117680619 [Crassostrea gigas]
MTSVRIDTVQTSFLESLSITRTARLTVVLILRREPYTARCLTMNGRTYPALTVAKEKFALNKLVPRLRMPDKPPNSSDQEGGVLWGVAVLLQNMWGGSNIQTPKMQQSKPCSDDSPKQADLIKQRASETCLTMLENIVLNSSEYNSTGER